MLVRPTIDPLSTKLILRVYGQRGGHLMAQARAVYEGELADIVSITATLTPRTLRQRRHLGDGVMVRADERAERGLVDFLSWWPGEWQDDHYLFRTVGELEFLKDGLSRVAGSGIVLEVEEGLGDIMSDDPLQVAVHLQVKGPWFQIRVATYAGDRTVSPLALARAAQKGRSWVQVHGKAVQVPETVDLGLLAEAADSTTSVHRQDRTKIQAAVGLLRDAQMDGATVGLLREVLYAEAPEEVPDKIRAELYGYQKEGFAWCKRMLCSGTGGILADAPGLGKTLTTICAIVAMKTVQPLYRVMIFCPKSLVFNWAKEFRKFAPHLDVLAWDGPNRKKYTSMLGSCDVVLASFETMKRDKDILAEVPFHLAVFDEAQGLKNSDTASHKAAASIAAGTRLALTGTPIENRLEDIHAIFTVACPGLLPPLAEFKEKVVRPFKAGDPAGLEAVRDNVMPFILRRTKEQVLTDLPPKTIIDHYCEMTDRQAAFYEQAKADARAKRDQAIAEGDERKKSALFLTLLTRLRHIATDPRLEDPVHAYAADDSGKIQAFRSLMDTIDTDEANKVLVFSQWTSCLDLVKQELDKRKHQYSYLTGDTKDRDVQVHNFQERPEVRYFLLSLKAGGVGLNITAANYVVIFDPWWNPAIEMQAFDRAHRIGQKRNVTVYRMIAPGTIEQRIADLQSIKKAIADGMIDDAQLPDFSTNEMAKLLD